ncbi:MAG: hypothetical protein R2873_27460 [Caldilineaceae bacterium]
MSIDVDILKSRAFRNGTIAIAEEASSNAGEPASEDASQVNGLPEPSMIRVIRKRVRPGWVVSNPEIRCVTGIDDGDLPRLLRHLHKTHDA